MGVLGRCSEKSFKYFQRSSLAVRHDHMCPRELVDTAHRNSFCSPSSPLPPPRAFLAICKKRRRLLFYCLFYCFLNYLHSVPFSGPLPACTLVLATASRRTLFSSSAWTPGVPASLTLESSRFAAAHLHPPPRLWLHPFPASRPPYRPPPSPDGRGHSSLLALGWAPILFYPAHIACCISSSSMATRSAQLWTRPTASSAAHVTSSANLTFQTYHTQPGAGAHPGTP